MSLSKDPELKKAILALPQKEKDKLLTRLINKDKLLIKQLHFQLLENEDDLNNRTSNLSQLLHRSMDNAVGYIYSSPYPKNYKRLTAEMRSYSGLINEYAYITKNIFNELQLRLLVINKSFELFPKLFQNDPYGNNNNLLKHQAGKIKMVMTKLQKLHPDLQFDLAEAYETMQGHIANSALSSLNEQ